ncbi:Uncharacterised protein [Mycobacteroides abscessus subsp. abscessus]|nr:Uncharacterised protein [Mycobacteroides abscessus subsp. abscessus]
MIDELKAGLEGSQVVVHELDQHINDAGFGKTMAEALHRRITGA